VSDVRTTAFRRIRQIVEPLFAFPETGGIATEIDAIASQYASSSESADEKARRLLIEGRLTVKSAGLYVNPPIVAICRGDTGEIYALGYDAEKAEWRCTCEARGDRCSHLIALRLVTVKPS
jgi:hypothetical protein